MGESSHITGKLSREVIIDGITYRPGETITIPVQFGLEDYFEDYEYCTKEDND